MNFVNSLKRTVLLIIVISLITLTAFNAFAVPEDVTSPPEENVTEVVATEVVTDPVTEIVTDPETMAPTDAQTDAPTEAKTEKPTKKPTEEPTEVQETTLATYATTETLPEVTAIETVTAVTLPEPEKEEHGDLTYGIVSWCCVIVGVLAVFIVLISNKTQRLSRNGKHRYDEGDKITGQKRLLNDDYYNNRKYNSYYNKDTRK